MNITARTPCPSPWISAWLPGLLIAVSLALGSPALQAGPPAKVLSARSTAYGKPLNEWSAAWWQWVGSIPASSNPLLDQTGQSAASGQSGNVWFLAGNMGGVTERTVVVPAGKALLVPLLNTMYLGFPCDERGLPGCEVDQALEAAKDIPTLLSFITPSMDGAILSCEIDGIPVLNLSKQRVESSAIYSVTLGEENLFGLPPGPYHPCVDTGYYLFLAPLSVGTHTLHFAAATADESFSLDVTYHITVE